MLSKLIYRPYKILHQIVFPPKCLVCERFFQAPVCKFAVATEKVNYEKDSAPFIWQNQFDKLLSVSLCRTCIRGLVTVESPICDCCGAPFKSRHGTDHRCGDCMTEPKKFRLARAPLIYEEILTKVIHCFKYKGKIQLARPLSEILLTAFRLFWEKNSFDMVLPVPLHINKFRKRGFNQAYLLIRSWKDIVDSQIERDLLVRAVATAPQTALGRAKRAVNIKNAFDIYDPDKVKDKRVLLIDDVYTTGATVDECARLLMDCGARYVDVLTLARAV